MKLAPETQAAEDLYHQAKPARRLVLLLCLAGLIISLELARLHYKVHTDPDFHSFCAINSSFNCETVAESPYSVFLGLPVAVWGALGYALMGALAIAAFSKPKREAAHFTLICLAAGALLCSIVLALVSYCIICSFCLLCTISYLINISILLTLAATTKFKSFPWKEALRTVLRYATLKPHRPALAVLALALLIAAFPRYWEKGAAGRRLQGLPAGMTPEGQPWIGAENPILTITEYSDYLCPHCHRGHLNIRNLILANPGKIRLIHRHFPLDQECNSLIQRPFHQGACLLSKAAYCAGEQEKFWEMNDRLIHSQISAKDPLNDLIARYARELAVNRQTFVECLNSKRAAKALKQDIDSGLSLGITGTPSFVVENKVYLGVIPDEILKKIKHQ